MSLEEFQDSAGEGQQPAKPEKDEPAGPTREEFAQLNSRYAELAEENRHNRELLQQFIQRSQPAKGDDDDDEPEVEGDVADDFANNGVAALIKRGLLTKKEARDIAREEARKIAREEVENSKNGMMQDAALAKDFPELLDEQSELFQRTQAIYTAEVKADPAAAKNPRTLIRAAKEAKADLISEGKYGNRRNDDDSEERRQRRIDAQYGERGRGGRGSDDDNDDNTLSPRQRFILNKFIASGEAEIDEQTYIKRAQNVKMGGIPKFAGGR
jgi:hypothetical protein